MSLEDIDPQFRLDEQVAPTFVVKNYNIENGEFEVFYNDGTLKNDEWYGPLYMDLDSMKPDNEEPMGEVIGAITFLLKSVASRTIIYLLYS